MSANVIETLLSNINRDRDNINSYVLKVKQEMENMYYSMNELNSTWEGDTKEAFIELFESDFKFLKDVIKLVDDFCDCMDYAEKEYAKCEKAVEETIDMIWI